MLQSSEPATHSAGHGLDDEGFLMCEFQLARKDDMDLGRRGWDEDIAQTEEMEGRTSVGLICMHREPVTEQFLVIKTGIKLQ